MFENYENAKVMKRRTWATVLLTVSVAVHVVVFLVLIIRSFWVIKKLDAPHHEDQIAVAPPPPPPPKGNPGHKIKDLDKPPQPHKHKVTETVQPVKIEQKVEDPNPAADTDNPNATPDGSENGQDNGMEGGVDTGGPPPAKCGDGMCNGDEDFKSCPADCKAPAPVAPQIVAPNVLNANRISGDTQIQPDDVTKTAISRSGKSRVIASAKICLDKNGTITSVSLVKTTGFQAYDDEIRSAMGGWRYRPYTVNGVATPACTAITFIYNQPH
jgi:TonB family protein